MAQVIKKATRESFGMALCELAKTNKDIIVFDADLAAATKTGIFKKEFPERFFDCGIAEGNMVGVAAGMAAAGKIPVAASFAFLLFAGPPLLRPGARPGFQAGACPVFCVL